MACRDAQSIYTDRYTYNIPYSLTYWENTWRLIIMAHHKRHMNNGLDNFLIRIMSPFCGQVRMLYCELKWEMSDYKGQYVERIR